jgi:hypothetical protein
MHNTALCRLLHFCITTTAAAGIFMHRLFIIGLGILERKLRYRPNCSNLSLSSSVILEAEEEESMARGFYSTVTDLAKLRG